MVNLIRICCTVFVVIVQCDIQFIQSADCSYSDRSADGLEYIWQVECKHVYAMSELAGQMETFWTNLAIINQATVAFVLAR